MEGLGDMQLLRRPPWQPLPHPATPSRAWYWDTHGAVSEGVMPPAAPAGGGVHTTLSPHQGQMWLPRQGMLTTHSNNTPV